MSKKNEVELRKRLGLRRTYVDDRGEKKDDNHREK